MYCDFFTSHVAFCDSRENNIFRSLIFKQERVGLHNEKFMMYKFRTMYVQTEEEEKKGWTQKNDPRVTKSRRFLRKTSLDEFPQLLMC